MKFVNGFALMAVLAVAAPASAEIPAALRGIKADVLQDEAAAGVRGESGSISTWGSFNFQHNSVEGALVQFQNKNLTVVAAGKSASVSYAGNVWDPTGIWARSNGGPYKSLTINGGASGDIHVKGTINPYLRGAGNISFTETAGSFAQGNVGQFNFTGGSRNGLDIGIRGNKINFHTLGGGAFHNTTATGAGTFRFPR